MSTKAQCFHCGEPIPTGCTLTVTHEDKELPVCCTGCQSVALLIMQSGLGNYYQFREAEAIKAPEDREQVETAWLACDTKESLWGQKMRDGSRELLLQTEGIHCAACAWLIRSRLTSASGINDVQVDVSTGYTRILWHPKQTRLSRIASHLLELGYRPHLPLAADEERGRQQERRQSLKRVGVAGLGMMQVMMYAVGLYAGDFMGISGAAERFLQWISLLVTLPVVLYSARPFYTSAIHGLKARQFGMDVPVALAISLAFVASCWNFLRGEGTVYFDSVVMFVFFLLLGRHVEMVLRHRNLQASNALARLLPEWAERLEGEHSSLVLLSELKAGDRVKVRAGESFPADGIINEGDTSVDESLLTGESDLVRKQVGDQVIAGSVNNDQPVIVTLSAVGEETTVSILGRLLTRAQGQRPKLASLAESIAGWFVLAVLLLASLTGLTWWFIEPVKAFPAVLAVLVVSCPCALSLATPAALAAAGRRLLNEGVLMTRSQALETLADVDTVMLDKTGTLTTGKMTLKGITLNPQRKDYSEQQVLEVAAAMERSASHPLAKAFSRYQAVELDSIEHIIGQGVVGRQDNQEYRLGQYDFALAGMTAPDHIQGDIWLRDNTSWIAALIMEDLLRGDADTVVKQLQSLGLKLCIASGDQQTRVESVASKLGVGRYESRQTAEDKLKLIQAFQKEGHKVLMVGDGVNDAPVLAAADVSMAMQGGADLASGSADLILGGDALAKVVTTHSISRQTRRVIRQNLSWALAYNLIAIPLAASAWLQPWMAALGMSISSLIVVLNARRLVKQTAEKTTVQSLGTSEVPV